jgi:hypothetical protein
MPECPPARCQLRGLQWLEELEALREVGVMSANTNVSRCLLGSPAPQRDRLPQLFNWLAVLVLLSLGVLV